MAIGNSGNGEPARGVEGAPGDAIRITRFDEVRLQALLDLGLEPLEQGERARHGRNERLGTRRRPGRQGERPDRDDGATGQMQIHRFEGRSAQTRVQAAERSSACRTGSLDSAGRVAAPTRPRIGVCPLSVCP